jgi:hypothetical protein
LGEYNRAKNSKNSSNTNLKVKFDLKENANSIKKNKKTTSKKGKNNSMDKNQKIELHNKFFGGDKNKKNTRNLSNNSLNNNYNNTKDKFSKTTSQISLYRNLNNSSLFESKSKTKILTQEKKLNSQTDNNNIKIPEIKNITQKEKACLILAFSKCLRLTERALFSFSSPKFKEAITKKIILNTNKIYLKEKLEELEEKINRCDNKLENKFNASKTAEITLNFVTLNIETDFKLNLTEGLDDETEKKYCDNYVKLLYLVLGESYDKIENNMLIKNLYNKIGEKKYQNIKDYLFYLYIQNKDENKSLENVDKINQIIKKIPDILNFKMTAKYDKFILYTSVIVNEIINFANKRFDTLKLKNDCKKMIEIINMKLNLYNRKNKSN